ncbi:hypothetical protein GCM10009789_23390 [Kribbella sancticallisti]|uniref:Tachylectin n=1 Tax=Kribbella sancticallisti TaxID=460087 RepID=A0ABN2D5Q7_9ACTN
MNKLLRSRATAALAVGVLGAGVLPGLAYGATTTTTTSSAACGISAGSITAAGDHRIQSFVATRPITRTENRFVARGIHPAGQAKLTSSWIHGPAEEGNSIGHDGNVVLGTVLYESGYLVPRGGGTPHKYQTRIGGGWGAFKSLEHSEVLLSSTSLRQNEYGLRTDGTLQRWNRGSDSLGRPVWRASGSAPGFSAVKTMALISQTKTYDTFLVNTRGGALYTVRIPTVSPMKPVVKKVRAATWQGFETMIAARCGAAGTLLLGIDKDTGSGYLYAMGHANGTATVIQGLGKVPGTFTDSLDFAWHGYSDPKLFGE